MILLFKKHQSDKSTRSPTLVVIFLLHESGQTMTFFMFGKLAVILYEGLINSRYRQIISHPSLIK
jgi:hypothetical protein